MTLAKETKAFQLLSDKWLLSSTHPLLNHMLPGRGLCFVSSFTCICQRVLMAPTAPASVHPLPTS